MEKTSFKVYFKDNGFPAKFLVAKSFEEVYESLSKEERESISSVYSETVTIL